MLRAPKNPPPSTSTKLSWNIYSCYQSLVHICQKQIAMKITIYRAANGKICRKSKADKYFAELSIFTGHFELLVADGYMQKYGSVTPSLGRSLDQFNLEYNGAFTAHVHTQRHSTLSHQFTSFTSSFLVCCAFITIITKGNTKRSTRITLVYHHAMKR